MLTDLSFLNIGRDWPPPSEQPRMERYFRNRQLWDNKHTEVYGDWWRVLREEYGISHEILFNFHKRVSTLWADLVFGDPPNFIAGEQNSAEQDTIKRIVEDTQFHTVGYENVLDVSRYGDALIKLRLRGNKAYIQAQSPAIWYPVVSLDDQREVIYHVFAWSFEDRPGESDANQYLRVEIHDKGRIFNRLHQLKNDKIGERVELAAFFPSRLEEEETRLDTFMIFHVPGLRASDEFFGKDDYLDIDSTILEYMARNAQISRVQDQHSDPNLSGPEDLMRRNPVTGAYELKVGGKYFPVPPGEDRPEYLVWDASQENQFKFMDNLKRDLYEVSETTPTAFGNSETGYAESGTSLRLRMVPPLAKAQRVRLRFDSVIKDLLIRAAELESAWGGDAAVPESVNIAWEDGLPRDPREEAEIETMRQSAGIASRYSSIKRLDGGTDDEIQEEIDRIDEDKAAGAATNPAGALDLFGAPATDQQSQNGNQGQNQGQQNQEGSVA